MTGYGVTPGCRRWRTRPFAQRGISMVEVLAAMVIFSSSAAVLFSWIGQTTGRLSKLDGEQQALFSELSALDYVRGLNPMLNPEGQADLQKGVRLSWRSTAVGAAEPALSTMSTPGIYLVQLFKVELLIRAERGAEIRQTLLLAGWKQTVEVRRELPFQLQ